MFSLNLRKFSGLSLAAAAILGAATGNDVLWAVPILVAGLWYIRAQG